MPAAPTVRPPRKGPIARQRKPAKLAGVKVWAESRGAIRASRSGPRSIVTDENSTSGIGGDRGAARPLLREKPVAKFGLRDEPRCLPVDGGTSRHQSSHRS